MAKIDMPTSSLNQIPGQQPKKKLEKVTTGKVTVRQQTDIQKVVSAFLAEDLATVKERIRNVENAANRKLRTNGHLFLNEVIDMLDPYGKGCHRTAVGQVAGWIYDPKDETKQNCVSLGTHCYVPGNEALNDFINGDERSVMLHFNCDGPIIDKI